MKPLILALLLFPLVGIGQKDTTPTRTLTGGHTLTLTDTPYITIGSGVTWLSVGNKPKNDTTRCVMLVSDTTILMRIEKNKWVDSIGNGGWYVRLINDTVYFSPTHHSVTWQFGYEVKVSDGWNMKTYYLNEDKSPMRKSVVVWMVKNL